LLGDEPAHRVPEDVDTGQAKSVDEALGVPCGGLDSVRRSPGGGGHAGVVEQNDFAVGGKPVAEGRIVVVEFLRWPSPAISANLHGHQDRTGGRPRHDTNMLFLNRTDRSGTAQAYWIR
jgi:hypothetical protein